MKKLILTAGLAALLMGSASAAEPTTLTDKADKLDEVIFGEVQQGSFLERVSAMDEAVYGGTGEGEGLDGRVSDLYRDVIRDESSSQPSLSTRVNTLEYYLTDEIKQDALESRVEMLESTVFGVGKTGALDVRVNELERAVYGNTHFELVTVTLPADTVFKISLNEEISSKVNMEGDIVHFTVQEDVLQDGVLVLPRGAQGSGVVTKVSRPKFFGRSGSLEISFNQVFSIDAEEIPTVLGPESQEKGSGSRGRFRRGGTRTGPDRSGGRPLREGQGCGNARRNGALYPDTAGRGDPWHEAGRGRAEGGRP